MNVKQKVGYIRDVLQKGSSIIILLQTLKTHKISTGMIQINLIGTKNNLNCMLFTLLSKCEKEEKRIIM